MGLPHADTSETITKINFLHKNDVRNTAKSMFSSRF